MTSGFPRKIETARMDVEAGRTLSTDEVDAEAVAWRAEVLRPPFTHELTISLRRPSG